MLKKIPYKKILLAMSTVEWGAMPLEQVTVMPLYEDKSDTPAIFLASCLNRDALFVSLSAGYACGHFSCQKILPYLVIVGLSLGCELNHQLFVFPNRFTPAVLNGICVGHLNLIINILFVW